jgi:hypothetical protein
MGIELLGVITVTVTIVTYFFCDLADQIRPRPHHSFRFLNNTPFDTCRRYDSRASDQLLTEVTTYITHCRKRQMSMSTVAVEPAVLIIKRLQACILNRAATGVCLSLIILLMLKEAPLFKWMELTRIFNLMAFIY